MGRLVSDRMSYRNHYMCSGEATSNKNARIRSKFLNSLEACFRDRCGYIRLKRYSGAGIYIDADVSH